MGSNWYDAALEAISRKQSFCLATIVHVKGSAYRRPGAQMVISDDGKHVGSISGGCLEGEIIDAAKDVLSDKNPVLVHLSTEIDPISGYGTGCGGEIDVLLEYVDGSNLDALESERRIRSERRTVLQLLTFNTDGIPEIERIRIDVTNEEIPTHLPSELQSLMKNRNPGDPPASGSIKLGKKNYRYLVSVKQPPVHIVIFGNNTDIAAVVDIAKLLGWQVTVVGNRPQSELESSFPDSDAQVFIMHADDIGDRIHFDERTACLVMTHSFERDAMLLRSLLPLSCSYLGMLGPRKRFTDLCDHVGYSPETLQHSNKLRLFAPMGFDLGGDTPEEIALSCISEIQAVMNRTSGGHLSRGKGPIHAR